MNTKITKIKSGPKVKPDPKVKPALRLSELIQKAKEEAEKRQKLNSIIFATKNQQHQATKAESEIKNVSDNKCETTLKISIDITEMNLDDYIFLKGKKRKHEETTKNDEQPEPTPMKQQFKKIKPDKPTEEGNYQSKYSLEALDNLLGSAMQSYKYLDNYGTSPYAEVLAIDNNDFF